MAPRPPDAPPDLDLSVLGALEALPAAACLAPETTFVSSLAYRFPDEEILARALVAPGLVLLVGPDRKAAIVTGLAPYRPPTAATCSRSSSATARARLSAAAVGSAVD